MLLSTYIHTYIYINEYITFKVCCIHVDKNINEVDQKQ